VAEEGMINSSPTVDEGAGSSAAGGGAADVAEAAEGEIIATSAGANFFAISKKAFISSRVRPWEEFTFGLGKRACKNTNEYKESKSTEVTYVTGRNRRCMGLKGDISFFGLLQALEVSRRRNLLDRGPGNAMRNFLGRGLIINYRGN
jgi:hypothetical protein